jgi:hypothetical protein
VADEFEGDLAGAVFWGADLSGALFRDVDLTDASISHALLVSVDIDATIDRLVVNGVDVTAYVNERAPGDPLRAVVRTSDPQGMRDGWSALQEAWAATTAQAARLAEADLSVSVDGEWPFVQTLRHLVFAADKWFTVPILGEGFHPLGLPNTGSRDFPWPGLALDVQPSLAEVVAVRADRAARLGEYLATVTADDLSRTVDVLENGPNPIAECIGTVFEEEFWHNRYARRDLDRLEALGESPDVRR